MPTPTETCTCTPTQLCPPCTARGYTNPLAGYAARIYPTPVCPLCADRYADDEHIDPELLCRPHEAEWEGLSLDQLDRRDAIEASELADLY